MVEVWVFHTVSVFISQKQKKASLQHLNIHLLGTLAHVHRAHTIFALCDPDTDSGSADGAPLSGPHSRVCWQIGAYIQSDANNILPQMTGSPESSHFLAGLSKQKFIIYTLYISIFI